MLSFQAVLMFAAIPVIKIQSPVLLVIIAALIGFNYGTNLSLFPSLTKDFWGLKNFGPTTASCSRRGASAASSWAA